MFNKKIRDIISAEVPDYLIKQRDGGGGKMLSYLSGSTIIDILNAAFNYDWDWIVEKEWLEISQPKFNQYSKAPEKDKVMHNGKMGSWEKQPPVAHVRGTLIVRTKDEAGQIRSVVKAGYGSKTAIGGASEQESIFKAAGTDALKKAASLLGIGLQLYRDENETYFYNELTYEDPWTDEAKEEFETERSFITSFMQKYNLNEDSMVQVLHEYDSDFTSLEWIIPENIKDIVAFLQQKEAEAEKESQNK